MLRASTAIIATTLLAGPALAQGDVARGEKRFEECAACHKLAADAHDVGPSLFAVVGRKAADLSDFRYSPAMRRSGLV
ncbi:MAG: c-type cytochrome [Hyphomicrobiales bacterium]|nr:c-type cytochrome [Hyphomicrobiales bacterium]